MHYHDASTLDNTSYVRAGHLSAALVAKAGDSKVAGAIATCKSSTGHPACQPSMESLFILSSRCAVYESTAHSCACRACSQHLLTLKSTGESCSGDSVGSHYSIPYHIAHHNCIDLAASYTCMSDANKLELTSAPVGAQIRRCSPQ